MKRFEVETQTDCSATYQQYSDQGSLVTFKEAYEELVQLQTYLTQALKDRDEAFLEIKKLKEQMAEDALALRDLLNQIEDIN